MLINNWTVLFGSLYQPTECPWRRAIHSSTCCDWQCADIMGGRCCLFTLSYHHPLSLSGVWPWDGENWDMFGRTHISHTDKPDLHTERKQTSRSCVKDTPSKGTKDNITAPVMGNDTHTHTHTHTRTRTHTRTHTTHAHTNTHMHARTHTHTHTQHMHTHTHTHTTHTDTHR